MIATNTDAQKAPQITAATTNPRKYFNTLPSSFPKRKWNNTGCCKARFVSTSGGSTYENRRSPKRAEPLPNSQGVPMANWVSNLITILVPEDRRVALLAALEGPEQYSVPPNAVPGRDRQSLSAHEEIELVHLRSQLEQEFRSHPFNQDYPDWMPVSRQSLIQTRIGTIQEIPKASLSPARLNPVRGRAEFDRFFPGKTKDGIWEPVPVLGISNERGHRGLYTMKFGTNSILFDLELKEQPMGERGTILRFTYNTKTNPILTFLEFLPDVLRAHGAKALHVWTPGFESGGFEYMNPEADQGFSLELYLSLPEEEGLEDAYVPTVDDAYEMALEHIDDRDGGRQPS